MEEFGLRRLQGQGRWWLLEGWGEVEVVRQPTYCCPRRAGQGDLLASRTPLGPKDWDVASGSGWACRVLKPCEGGVVDQLDK